MSRPGCRDRGDCQPALRSVQAAKGAGAVELPERKEIEEVDDRAQLGDRRPDRHGCQTGRCRRMPSAVAVPQIGPARPTRRLLRVNERLLQPDDGAQARDEQGGTRLDAVAHQTNTCPISCT